MTALLSKEFLEIIGVKIDDIEYDLLSNHFEHTLNERVMTEVVNYLDDSQVIDFARIKDSDDDTLRAWLIENVSQLDEIIEEEVAILLGEIAEHADSL